MKFLKGVWYSHDGLEKPDGVPDDALIEAQMEDGQYDVVTARAGDFDWYKSADPIKKFRIIKGE